MRLWQFIRKLRGLALAGVAGVFLAPFLVAVPLMAAPEKRIALVIGVGHYQSVPQLANPVHDAHRLAQALRALKFDVTEEIDPDYRTMSSGLRNFGIRAQEADAALVFYAGHGIQVNHENYLIPADAKLERERDLFYETMPLSLFLDEVSQAKKVGIVILDACRNNPFVDRLARSLSIAGRDAGRPIKGLAKVDSVPRNTIVAMATRADAIAEDGTGEDSPFTEAILAHLRIPGLELGLFFRSVRDTVLRETDNRQEPFVYSSLGAEPFYLNPPSAKAASEPTGSATADVAQIEHAWDQLRKSGSSQDINVFLKFFSEALQKEAERRDAEKKAAGEAGRKDMAQKEAEHQATLEAAQREADRKAAKKEEERKAAEAAAKKEEERKAAEAAAKKEEERKAAEAAAKKEEERKAAAEALKKETERQAAAEAARKEIERQAAAAARKDAERQAADAAKRTAERQAFEAAKKEEARKAAEALRKEGERKAAEAVRKEAERELAEAARKEAEETARKETERKAALEQARREKEEENKDKQLALLPPPSVKPPPALAARGLTGRWCAGSLSFVLSANAWVYNLPGGSTVSFPVRKVVANEGSFTVYWEDDQKRPAITEFTGMTDTSVVQYRGRPEADTNWHYYNRTFTRCER